MAGNAGKGRPKGSLNKATADVKEAARKHGPSAIKKLATLMDSADSDTAKIAACREILDRAYGKSAQQLDVTLDVASQLARLLEAGRKRANG